MNRIGNLLIGAVVGAVLVGGSWYITSHTGSNSSVVASVGKNSITRANFLTQLQKDYGSSTLGRLVTNQLILDGAKKNNITATTQDVDTALNDLKTGNNITSDAQLNSALASNHMTLQDLRDQLKIQVLEQKIAEKDVTVSDTDIQTYYNQNKDTTLVTTPETVTASHILVATQDDANKVEQRLKNGEDFAAVAKDVSTDTGSKASGGQLPPFTKGQMDPAFETAAFALKVGDTSQPVQSQFGWHVIKVTAHQQPVIPALADVKQKISDTLKQQKAKQPADVLSQLAKDDGININDASYTDVKNNILNPPPAQNTPSGGVPTTDPNAVAPTSPAPTTNAPAGTNAP
ncbi:MAG: PpiC-type peptidyl-prolyl cis-trans isomerase [Bacilli bacterium]|nr:PpiC-type peptidyl-prolyl cis-trans isomerase [Bacilli bacterium]